MKIIGHRGARGLAPENTLLAIKRALEHNVDEIEFDLRVTKDNVVILHHNPEITNGNAAITIATAVFSSLLSHKPDITTLDEALNLIEARAVCRIEVKRNVPIKPIVAVIEAVLASGIYNEYNLSLGSKSQSTLRQLHIALPSIPMVVIESWSGTRARLRCRELGTKRLSMKATWLWKGFLKPMYKRGYMISAYTMNDPTKVNKWRQYLDGVITDYPDRFQTYINADNT